MSIINEYIAYYKEKLDFYREAARICAQICETNMEQRGIRTIVTSRAKNPERLREKLEKRNRVKYYRSLMDINQDITDLSGVRIALYFPGDLYKVQQFIESKFLIKECKVFPEAADNPQGIEVEYKKRFLGYWATHYRVYIKEKDLPENLRIYSDTVIEIQVASALMHAWAEVEHDLVYKPFSGELSYEEYQILDELNGLVHVGEIALQRLQRAVKNRVSQVGMEFNNHYELAMFLNNKLGSSTEGVQKEVVLGRVDLLYNCIKLTDFNKPESFRELLLDVDTDSKSRSVVEQIMDKIGENNPELYEKYRNMKQGEELQYQLNTLHINHENGNRQGEANTLANIGYLYNSKENYDEAINYFSRAVKINQEIGGIQGEANQLLNLGSTYRLKGDLEKALDYCNQAIVLHRRISYKQGQANTLGMIGNIYADKRDFPKAYEYNMQALTIYKETSYKIGEVIQLNNLGLLYLLQNEIDRAELYFNQVLTECKGCDYKQGEIDALHHLGNIYAEKNEPEQALGYYERALTLQAAEGNMKNKILVLLSVGKLYSKIGRTEAEKYFKEAHLLSNNIGYKSGSEEAQRYINKLQ